ncbi:hypothetical protein ABPG74_006846 [Tetrahymena malaccensis]
MSIVVKQILLNIQEEQDLFINPDIPIDNQNRQPSLVRLTVKFKRKQLQSNITSKAFSQFRKVKKQLQMKQSKLIKIQIQKVAHNVRNNNSQLNQNFNSQNTAIQAQEVQEQKPYQSQQEQLLNQNQQRIVDDKNIQKIAVIFRILIKDVQIIIFSKQQRLIESFLNYKIN